MHNDTLVEPLPDLNAGFLMDFHRRQLEDNAKICQVWINFEATLESTVRVWTNFHINLLNLAELEEVW